MTGDTLGMAVSSVETTETGPLHSHHAQQVNHIIDILYSEWCSFEVGLPQALVGFICPT